MAVDILNKAQGEGNIRVTEISDISDPVLKKPATKIEVLLSNNPEDGLMWWKVLLYFDRETKLPLHFRLYTFDGSVSGDYAFTRFIANTNITDADFDL